MTRNMYIRVAKTVRGKETLTGGFLIAIALGGFVALFLAVVLSAVRPGSIEIFGKSWFSASAVAAVVFLSGQWFNPERAAEPSSLREGQAVLLLDAMLAVAALAWAFE